MKKKVKGLLSPLSRLEILVGLYIACLFASETMGFKLIPLVNFGEMHFSVSVSIFLLPFLFSINDMIIETYGLRKALAVSRLGFLVIALIAVMGLMFTSLPAAERFLSSSDAYNSVFGFSIRVCLASLIGFAVAQVTDILIFKKIRERLGKKSLWLRTNVSNIVGLLLDTVIFMSIARYNVEMDLGWNMQYLVGLILPYWIFKCLVSAMITPLTYAGVKWLKRDEADKASSQSGKDSRRRS